MTATAPSRPNLGQILIRLKLITEEQVQTALELQQENGRLFGECLLELGHIGEDDLSWALSSQLGLPFMNVVGRDVRSAIPRSSTLATFSAATVFSRWWRPRTRSRWCWPIPPTRSPWPGCAASPGANSTSRWELRAP